jgi:hypothetical protein
VQGNVKISKRVGLKRRIARIVTSMGRLSMIGPGGERRLGGIRNNELVLRIRRYEKMEGAFFNLGGKYVMGIERQKFSI